MVPPATMMDLQSLTRSVNWDAGFMRMYLMVLFAKVQPWVEIRIRASLFVLVRASRNSTIMSRGEFTVEPDEGALFSFEITALLPLLPAS